MYCGGDSRRTSPANLADHNGPTRPETRVISCGRVTTSHQVTVSRPSAGGVGGARKRVVQSSREASENRCPQAKVRSARRMRLLLKLSTIAGLDDAAQCAPIASSGKPMEVRHFRGSDIQEWVASAATIRLVHRCHRLLASRHHHGREGNIHVLIWQSLCTHGDYSSRTTAPVGPPRSRHRPDDFAGHSSSAIGRRAGDHVGDQSGA